MRPLDSLAARAQAWWSALALREQRLVGIAATLVGTALIWWTALAPALRTLASAPAEQARLDTQLQMMTALQAQARMLQSQPRAHRDDALRDLESSVRQHLGDHAQWQNTGMGESVRLQLHAVPADVLAQWLVQARGNARALPREAHLTQSPATNPDAGGTDTARVRWDGTLVMNLPAR